MTDDQWVVRVALSVEPSPGWPSERILLQGWLPRHRLAMRQDDGRESLQLLLLTG